MKKKQFLNPLLFQLIFYLYLISFLLNISIINCIREKPNLISNKEQLSQNSLYIKKDIYLNKNSLLVTKIKIGSNNKEFNLLLDTCSQTSWVPLINSMDVYPLKNHYNPKESNTSKELGGLINVEYAYTCRGYQYEDEVEFIDNKKFKLNFGAMNETTFKANDTDGIIGLAFNYHDESKSFMNALKKEGIVDSLSFSIKLNENINNNFNGFNKVGELYLGKHEDFNKNEVISCPLKSDYSDEFWACELNLFSLDNSKSVINSEFKSTALFDIASNVIILPKNYFNNNNFSQKLKDFNCKFVIFGESESQIIQIVCYEKENLPDMKFKLNEQIFTIPKESCFDCRVKNGQKEECFSRVIFKGEIAYIGFPFFYFYHTLFDEEGKAIRFYPLKKESKEEKEDGFKTIYLLYIIPSVVIGLGIIVFITICCVRYHSGKKNESFVLGIKPNNSEITDENDALVSD